MNAHEITNDPIREAKFNVLYEDSKKLMVACVEDALALAHNAENGASRGEGGHFRLSPTVDLRCDESVLMRSMIG